MTRFLAWLRGIWSPAPSRPRRIYGHYPCLICGRTVAHTKTGRAWRHVCVSTDGDAA